MGLDSITDRTSRHLSSVSTEVQNNPETENIDEYIKSRLNELTEFNWRFIGRGSGRFVYTHGSTNNAFKISRPSTNHRSDGVIQNTVEVFAYHESISDSKYEELFLPIIDFDEDFLWVSMPKGERINNPDELQKAVNKIHREVDWLDRFDVSTETRQFVRWNGSIRLADYGQFNFEV